VLVLGRHLLKILTKLAELIDQQNDIDIHIDKTFPLDNARIALNYQKDTHPRGKIVLAIEGR
jgi:NADPH:quinone reductase-like Zn-dependent oxidoreductase